MQKCPACRGGNIPEKIVHWILSRVGETENFIVEHYLQNGTEDIQGKDLGILFRKRKYFIQVKGYREIPVIDMKKRVMILERRFRDFNRDSRKFRRYIYTTVNRYKRLDLLKNDREIREKFKKFTQTTSFFRKLNGENDFQKILELFTGVEYFINIFEAAIVHSERYPSVKLFFIVDMSKCVDRRKRTAALMEDCMELIKRAFKEQQG